MLHSSRLMALFATLTLMACAERPPAGSTAFDTMTHQGQGGSTPALTLPFPSGEYWYITQTYEGGSHVDYGFEYGDDRFALDFSQSGCEAYGKKVTPILGGTVLKVFTDGDNDGGYGNSVLVDHGLGLVSRYAHFSELFVEQGDSVTINTPLGEVGNSGYAVGSACPDYPGTHLHLALYQDKEGIKPEPLSGVSTLEAGCWISREGWVDCGNDPGDYTPIEDEGEMNIRMVDHSPHWGTAEETEFVWIVQIESEELQPEATLHIYNERDGVSYEFDMETESQENPWIFVYQKQLRDEGDYRYWVNASNGDGNDQSSTYTVEVRETSHLSPEIVDYWAIPMDDEEYEWRVRFETPESPDEVLLNIVNPYHSTIFNFEMNLWHTGDVWEAGYEKRLDDETVYPYWMNVDNGQTIRTTPVQWLRAND